MGPKNVGVFDRAEWVDWAECRDKGDGKGDKSHLMFPYDEDKEGIKAAKDVCADCPVLAECLAYAMDRFEKNGVWGGLTAEERHALRRTQNRTARLAA